MFTAVAMTALMLSAATADRVMAREESANAQPASRATKAEERARQALAQQLKVAPESIEVIKVEPHTWSDSSMGCGKPGTMSLTVITEGHAVSLRAQGQDHEVHVSNAGAVVCDKGPLLHREQQRSANARGLDVMMERARQDLAQRLGVEASKIRLAGMQPQRWPDSSLGCPRAGESVQAGPVDGFRLMLKHGARVYTYHTDRKDLRPCPAIESQ
jgi:hypothetical protein